MSSKNSKEILLLRLGWSTLMPPAAERTAKDSRQSRVLTLAYQQYFILALVGMVTSISMSSKFWRYVISIKVNISKLDRKTAFSRNNGREQ